jgi:dynein intermediate chain 2, axonemal
LLGVCGDDGATTILRLGDGLSVLQTNEKSTISQLLDKEARREKNVETAAREAKARKQPSQGVHGAPGKNKRMRGRGRDEERERERMRGQRLGRGR